MNKVTSYSNLTSAQSWDYGFDAPEGGHLLMSEDKRIAFIHKPYENWVNEQHYQIDLIGKDGVAVVRTRESLSAALACATSFLES